MEPIYRAARLNPTEAQRQRSAHDAATRRVAEHYATTYGPDFAAQVRGAHDEFDF